MKRPAFFALSLLLAASAMGRAHGAAAESYGETLVNRAVAGHKDIAALTMWAHPDDKSPLRSVASHGQSGAEPGDIDTVAKTGKVLVKQLGPGRTLVDLPLLDASHRALGVLSVEYAATSDAGESPTEQAIALRDMLARRISHFKNLSDQAQVDRNIPVNSYAQHLVDMEMARHPEIVILAVHAATPKNKDPGIVASNIGRIGKKADEDDMRVIDKGSENREVDETGVRFEAEIPLLDVSGTRIGAVGVVYNYKAGDNKDKLVLAARAVRDDMRRHISNPANLVEPYPYVSKVSDRTLGQKIVSDTLSRHPDILILAFHVTPPGSKNNIIVASNIGRIGKVADEDDMRVVNTGKPNLEVNENGIRFEVESVLRDKAGNGIGAISIVLPYRKGDDKAALQKRADAISGEVAQLIPSTADLFKEQR